MNNAGSHTIESVVPRVGTVDGLSLWLLGHGLKLNLNSNLFAFTEALNLRLRQFEIELAVLGRLDTHGSLGLVDIDDPSVELFLGERLLSLSLLSLALLTLLALRMLLLHGLGLLLRTLLRLSQAGCRNERACSNHPEQCRLVHR